MRNYLSPAGLLLALHGISIFRSSFTGEITVSIPVCEQYNDMEVSVLHCNNGVLETIVQTVRFGRVTFVLDSLSPIAIVLPKNGVSPVNPANPGGNGGRPIGSGIGGGKFAPDRAITREEMAVIINNYANAAGYTLPVSREAVAFTDAALINDWALAAVEALQQAGIVSGIGGGAFNPRGTATRAEAATILRNLVENIIDESTAREWVQNEAGQWMYWTWDGKRATGWVQIGDKWYYFYGDGRLAVDTTIEGYDVGTDGARK